MTAKRNIKEKDMLGNPVRGCLGVQCLAVSLMKLLVVNTAGQLGTPVKSFTHYDKGETCLIY